MFEFTDHRFNVVVVTDFRGILQSAGWFREVSKANGSACAFQAVRKFPDLLVIHAGLSVTKSYQSIAQSVGERFDDFTEFRDIHGQR